MKMDACNMDGLMVMMSTKEKIISDIMINSWKKMENYIISMEMAV